MPPSQQQQQQKQRGGTSTTLMARRLVLNMNNLPFLLFSLLLVVIIALEQYAISILSCPDDSGESNQVQVPEHFPWDAKPLPAEMRLQYSPSLLDRTHPLVLLKRNIPLTKHYNQNILPSQESRQLSGECSCLNPKSTIECCSRTFRRSHKMGCVMSMNLLKQYPNQYQLAAEPKLFTYNLALPQTDYRDVIVLRDLYSSILSGYLYHHKGFECKMEDKIRDYLGEWEKHLSYKLQPPANGRSLCQYLKRTQPAIGMRAYIDWVMRYYYSPIFAHWALAQQIPEMKERTLTICYENLMSKDRDLETVQKTVSFFFNGTPPIAWDGIPPGHAKVDGGYKGGHSTTNDRTDKDKERLLNVIKEVDKNFYHGEIAWLNTLNPCGGKKK